jgi:eukaryotic-like serine/threonine-protein kinase
MTPERWRRLDDLFDEALRLDLAERDAWLRRACGDDEGLRAEVARLLDRDEWAAHNGFLTPPEPASRHVDRWSAVEIGPLEYAGAISVEETGRFAPKAAICRGAPSHTSGDARSLAQQRLRNLTIIYLLITGLMVFWKYVVRKDPNLTQAIPYAIVLAVLGGIVSFLSLPRPLSPSLLQVLELGMIGMLAAVFAFAQYHAMLDFSLRDDPVRAQLVMKNRVLFTAILILSYGIYVPKGWRRATLVVGPLAVLPFATLLALYLRHPGAMGWLLRVGSENGTTPLALLGFDAMILLALVAGSAAGAHTISRLRWQVMEAQQLGQYRLRRQLGAGGMGEVYLAEHQLLKRPCAVKLVRPGIESCPEALERFEREVRLTATLSHPNTVEIYDYGRTEDGTYYYVMEYLQGLSLAELVKRHAPVPPARAVYLLRQVCEALREAHTAGLIHRDIKPSNIFASRRGGMDDVAKLFDFGLVLSLTKNDAPQTSGEGRIFGTPLFMSPEQATGDQEIDGRSDIYSLGAVAYYLLTGRPPFDGDNGIGLMIAQARDPVVPPSQFRADIPEDLERVVLRCLAKDAADRFPDARSLERALGECICVDDWDQDRAAAWWRDEGREPASHATVTRTVFGTTGGSPSRRGEPASVV